MQVYQKHTKTDFLVERICFFSDAVFAIAITLMILEIHPPVVDRSDTSAIVWQKLAKKLPEFLGLFISFGLIGSAWMRHHQLFAYITHSGLRLLVVNLTLLLTIILFPFSTSFLFNSMFEGIVTKPQVLIYLAVPLFSNIILYRMFRMAHKRYIKIREEPVDEAFHRAIYEQGFMILSLSLAIAWVLIFPSQYQEFAYIFLAIGPLASSFRRKSNKKLRSLAK